MTLSEATILVVDDEGALRDIFARWLRSLGASRVLTAANGVEALALLEAPGAPAVHLLITDINMPEMDGVRLVRTLGERRRRLDSIIFISGFGEIDRREMYGLGANSFLSKPFKLDELQGVVERALASPAERWKTAFPVAPRQSAHLRFDGAGGADKLEDALVPGGAEGGAHAAGRVDARGRQVPEAPFQPAARFELGRGGFSAHTQEPLATGKISFVCRFGGGEEPQSPELIGEGYVRWRSRSDGAVGIEFSWLPSPVREWVVDRIRAEEPFSFIPPQ